MRSRCSWRDCTCLLRSASAARRLAAACLGPAARACCSSTDLLCGPCDIGTFYSDDLEEDILRQNCLRLRPYSAEPNPSCRDDPGWRVLQLIFFENRSIESDNRLHRSSILGCKGMFLAREGQVAQD